MTGSKKLAEADPEVFAWAAEADMPAAEFSRSTGAKMPVTSTTSTAAAAARDAPGSKASTVKVKALWTAQIRWLLNGPSCNLKKFFFSTFSSQTREAKVPPALRPVWPMPLPYPGRKAAPAGEDGSWCSAVDAMVVVLNWLHLGQPCAVPATYCGSAPLTGEQKGIVQRLKRLSSCWRTAEPVTAADMGRTAGKVETLEEMLHQLTSAAAQLVEKTGSGSVQIPGGKSNPAQTLFSDVQMAKEIEAQRLQFGGRPTFDPRPFLEPEAREMYADPLAHACSPHEALADPPRVQVRGKRGEVLQLLKKLDATGRLALFTRDQVRWHYRAGLFSLMKNLEVDRLILDSRPANILESPLTAWTQTMGCPLPLLDLVLDPSEVLVASGEDLKDYYYYYQVSSSRACRNAIAYELSYAEAQQFEAFSKVAHSKGPFVPALNTMAMGDLNAVEFGQQAHVMLALATGLRMDDLLTLRGKFPRQDWAVGVVIDDLIVVEKIPRSVPESGVSSLIAENMVAAYEAVGLKPNDKKRFRTELRSKFWGVSIDGEEGLLRATLDRSLPIAFITAQVAQLGFANRKLLEVLAGSWTSILQLRKRCMCLLATIFEDIQRHEYEEVFSLSAETVEELWCLVLLSPLFCADLRAQPVSALSLVDASDSWQAEVEATLPDAVAAELGRQKLTKAAWTKLLSPVRALKRLHNLLPPEEEIPEGEEVVRAHPMWTRLAKSLKFVVKQRKRIKKRTHINISELRAALRAEARVAKRHPNARPLIGSDSQVTLGSVIKGRSSSKALNCELKRALPDVLGYNAYSAFNYVNTHDNVADDPTRDRDCREPSMQLPDWFEPLLAGEFSQLDAFLAEHGADDSCIARLPEPPEELPSLPVERETLRHVRRKAHCRKRPLRTGLKLGPPNNPPLAAFNRREPWLPHAKLTDRAQERLNQLPRSQFVLPRGATWEDLASMPGHLDLFSGCRIAAKALANQTGRWVLCYDIKHSPSEDLLDERVQADLDRMLHMGLFLSVTAGPVCASFSRAVCPAVRSRAEPWGLSDMSENMRAKVAAGNAMAVWLARFMTAVCLLNIVWWVENPAGSFLWLLPPWQLLVKKFALEAFYTDYCRWGTPWRKRTKFFGRFAAAGLSLLCDCTKAHVQLRGYNPGLRISWTKAAEAYPPALAKFLAKAVAESLKPERRRRKLDVAACARSSSRRIGEAQNPGPRRRSSQHPAGDLNDVATVQPATRLLQTRAHQRFATWLFEELGNAVYDRICAAPWLQVFFLRSFGTWLYSKGEPMYVFRHLVVFLQQLFPAYRHCCADAWDLLVKWEILQPVEHRPPLPKMVLDAMLALGLQWGWKRWCAITALAFHGAMRIGEPLKAVRSDLVLPDEACLLEEVCFLRVASPKPGRRGRGKVQHARIADAFTVRLAVAVFSDLASDQPLYGISPSSYRRRWDKLLAALLIPKAVQLTPGCLRGGGAVFLYHSGTPVTDILWHMRLRHLCTLEYYLQETGASNVLQQLPATAKARVQACARMLPFCSRLSIS